MTEPLDELCIAVIGLDGRFPGAPDLPSFWRNQCEGRSGIVRLDDAALEAAGVAATLRADPAFIPVAANLEGIEYFDAEFFGIGAREAQALDPQHRLLLQSARNAVESAGYDPGRYEGEIGAFFGIGISQYLLHNLLPQPHVMQRLGEDYTVFGNQSSYASTRIAHKLNLRGPVLALDTACSSSLVTVHLACKALLNFECEMALAGGVQINLPQHSGYVHQPGAFRSPDGVCRSFDAAAQGTVFGSGLGIVLLKRLDDARRDGDTIFAVIRGSAVNNDGNDKPGFTAPGVTGQTAVIEKALAFSGVSADAVGYVETHGTGTPLGDPIEIAALTTAFSADTDRRAYCAIGSLKPSIGHLETAAGIAGLIRAILALREHKLPPSLNFKQANPEIDFERSPFFVNASLNNWTSDGRPRCAAVSSFGIGGTNAHVVLEEYLEQSSVGATRPWQLLIWSGKTKAALEAATRRLAAHLRSHPEQELADVAYTLHCGREDFPWRRMLVCDSRDCAIGELENESIGLTGSTGTESKPSVSFLFPGQGAQHVNMALALYRHEQVFRRVIDRCAELLQPALGLDLREVLYPSELDAQSASSRLEQTWLTQPVLFSVEYALAKQWLAWGIEPTAMLGHSVGEYVAACLADVFTLPDALKLVALRGRLMQGMPAGQMLAVALAQSELSDLQSTGWDLAAVNGPKACVLSASEAVIDCVAQELSARGIVSRRLRTSHAFHSAMMEPILGAFAAAVAGIPKKSPRRRFISNLSGDWITDTQATSTEYWVRHLRGTVQFAAGLQRLLTDSSSVLLEVGPGQTLISLARHLSADRRHLTAASLPHLEEGGNAQATMLSALGRLRLAGCRVDWAGFYADESRRRVPLPTYPYQYKRYWIDPPSALRDPPQPSDEGVMPMADWFYAPTWTSAPVPAPVPPGPRNWLLLSERADGIGAALALGLRGRGNKVTEVYASQYYCDQGDRIGIRLTVSDDYLRLLERLAADHSTWQVVHALCTEQVSAEPAKSANLAFDSLLLLAQAVGLQAKELVQSLTLLSCGLADVNGDEPLEPLKAAALGAIKVVAQEYPWLACRQLDLVDDGDIPAVLRELELPVPAPGARVALRGGRRWQSGFRPIPLHAEAGLLPPWRQHGVYLITGGLGELGLLFATFLARNFSAKLVLVSRKGLPPPEQWAAASVDSATDDQTRKRLQSVLQLEADGAQVLSIAADVADADAMRAVVRSAHQRFAGLNGVMHAAGVAGGGIIQRKSIAEAQRVLSPKLHGTQVLLDVLANEPLDFVVLHSSLLAITGGIGQADYCGANCALDLFAQKHSRHGLRIVSLNWDGWREAGMAARAGIFATDPTAGIDSAQGIRAMELALTQTRLPQVVICTTKLDQAIAQSARAPRAELLQLDQRPPLEIAYVAPKGTIESTLVGIWKDVLGIGAVGVHDNFFDLGGTSLLMSEVLRRIHRELDAELRITELFQFPTIHALALRLNGKPAADASAIDAAIELGNRRKDSLARKRRRSAIV